MGIAMPIGGPSSAMDMSVAMFIGWGAVALAAVAGGSAAPASCAASIREAIMSIRS